MLDIPLKSHNHPATTNVQNVIHDEFHGGSDRTSQILLIGQGEVGKLCYKLAVDHAFRPIIAPASASSGAAPIKSPGSIAQGAVAIKCVAHDTL